MRYLPLLLLVLAGNVSAQSPWKSDYPEYLPVLIVNTGSCEQWITEAEIRELAQPELLRARLMNELPPEPWDHKGLVAMAINTTCVDNGMAYSATLLRVWPGEDTFITPVLQPGIATGPMTNKSRYLNILKDAIYEAITKFLEANQ